VPTNIRFRPPKHGRRTTAFVLLLPRRLLVQPTNDKNCSPTKLMRSVVESFFDVTGNCLVVPTRGNGVAVKRINRIALLVKRETAYKAKRNINAYRQTMAADA